MQESHSITSLIDRDRFAPLVKAIAAELDALFVGVDVKAHPGKLDISDMLEMDIQSLPSIHIGWTKFTPSRSPAGHYASDIDLVAYVAVKDEVLLVEKKRLAREVVAQALGPQLIRILLDEDHHLWGLCGVMSPHIDRPVEFKPLFTARTYAKGIAYYAVTWTQSLIDEGRSIGTDYGQQFEVTEDGISSDDPDFFKTVVAQALLTEADSEKGGDDEG